MGDFAVRMLASFASFQKILRLSRKALPDLLMVDYGCLSGNGLSETEFIKQHAPQIRCLLLHSSCSSSSIEIADSPLINSCVLPVDSLGITRLVTATLKLNRRGALRGGTTILFKDVQLDCERFQIRLLPGDKAHTLPLKEAQILRMLLESPGVCVSRERIIERLWDGISVTPRTIDSHISRLRRRLEGSETQIESVYGGGYILR